MTRRRKWLGLSIVFILPVMLAAGLWLSRTAEALNRGKCSDNLRALGQAMLLYCNENKRAYPPDWGTLASIYDITPEVFLCPSTCKSVPANLSLEQSRDWINAKSDFVYLAADL